MKIWKRAGVGRRLMLTVLAVLLMAAALPVTASAAPMPSTGDLTIHKYALEDMNSIGAPGDGKPATNIPSDAVPLAGVEFTIWQINPSAVASVTTVQQAWRNILTATEQTGTTNSNGEVTFASLPQGLYYVAETKNSGNVLFCEPFVVSVPMEDVSSPGDWITDVHAYPKNQTISIDKFVAAEGTTDYYEVSMNLPVEGGERFNWYIRTEIPMDIDVSGAKYYIVTDTLSSYFDYQAGTVKLYIMPDSDSDLANCTVLSSSDYTVNFNAATNTLSVGLTSAGIAKVDTLVDSGARYAVIEYGCVVNDTAPQGVALYGGATLEYTRDTASGVSSRSSAQAGAVTLLSARNNTTRIALLASGTSNTVTVEVAMQPEVHTGKIEITKLADKTDKLLPGAEFGVAKTKADALAGNYIATGTTDSNGELIFSGLKYGLPGDDPTQNSNNTTFWLAETKAPDGYKLMKEPAEITFNYSQDGDSGKYYFARVKVYNVLTGSSGETSPKTGDESNLFLWLGIMALALAGIITAVILIRKNKANGSTEQ